jgi:hypothetical protein
MTDNRDNYSQLAAQLLWTQLRQMRSSQVQPEVSEGGRDKMVAAMAVAVAARRPRRRMLIADGAFLAVAAAGLLMIKTTSSHKRAATNKDATVVVEGNVGSGNSLVQNAVPKPLLDGTRLVEGDSVQMGPDSHAGLAFADGTRLVLSDAGHLHIDELAMARRFLLRGGHLQAHVAKLGHGERFIVDTPDAEVEVRGTVFEVSVEPAGDCDGPKARSTVAVDEGAVWVRSGMTQVLLHPGESWTSPCQIAPTSEPDARPATTTEGRSSVRSAKRGLSHRASVLDQVPTTAPAPAHTVRAPGSSSLAKQNNLFSEAMAAERKGDHKAALLKLDALIGRFPNGPLLESARTERQRILSVQSSP